MQRKIRKVRKWLIRYKETLKERSEIIVRVRIEEYNPQEGKRCWLISLIIEEGSKAKEYLLVRQQGWSKKDRFCLYQKKNWDEKKFCACFPRDPVKIADTVLNIATGKQPRSFLMKVG